MNHVTSTLDLLALSSLFAAAFVACGGSESTASTGTGGDGGAAASSSTGSGSDLTPEAQVAKLCDDAVGPLCEALFACCTDPDKLESAGKTVEGCKTKQATECKTDLTDAILPQVKAGSTVLNETKLAACVSSLVSMKAGGAACSRPPWFVLTFDCISAFEGTIAPGAACDASMLHDDEYIPCKDGVCEDGKCKAFLAGGAACDPSDTNVDVGGCNYPEGEVCIGTGTTGKCSPRGEIGAPCTQVGEDKDFSCKSMSCGPAGKCIAPTAYGICSQG